MTWVNCFVYSSCNIYVTIFMQNITLSFIWSLFIGMLCSFSLGLEQQLPVVDIWCWGFTRNCMYHEVKVAYLGTHPRRKNMWCFSLPPTHCFNLFSCAGRVSQRPLPTSRMTKNISRVFWKYIIFEFVVTGLTLWRLTNGPYGTQTVILPFHSKTTLC